MIFQSPAPGQRNDREREQPVVIKKEFSGGVMVQPDAGNTASLPIEPLPPPAMVTIPLRQHTGEPSAPRVRIGDKVAVGQIIGDASDISAAPVHSSVSGTVTAVERYPFDEDPRVFSITIENNGRDELASPIPYDKQWEESTADELLRKIRLSGIIDCAGDPVHARLAAARGGSIEFLIVNGLPDGPYWGAGARTLIERTEKVLLGAAIAQKITDAKNCVVVVNRHYKAVVEAVSAGMQGERFKGFSLETLKKTRYPAHSDRLLVRAFTGVELRAESGPPQAGCVVLSAAAVAALHEAIVELMPSFERVVTVAGPAINKPKNLLARVGTPSGLLLESCGANRSRLKKLVSGSPFSGSALQDVSTPVTKTTGALLGLDSSFAGTGDYQCIGCRRCQNVCPMRLAPWRFALQAHSGAVRQSLEWSIEECIECGCCAYVCPSRINLVHYIKHAKKMVSASGNAGPAGERIAA